MDAIRTDKIGRTFKGKRGASDVRALDGVDLTVASGELFGLLGPNGAGKTTLIKILTTLLLPTEGDAWVDGLHVERDTQELRWRIAVVSGGETSGYGLLTIREQLWMFSQFYGMPSKPAKARIEELLEVVGLHDVGDRKMSDLSTGMRQKVNIVRGLLTEPRVLFLDEPTLGLDVEVARDVRRYLVEWLAHGEGARTILLTTHYMAEADMLCDRIAIIDDGRIRTVDTARALKAQAGFRERYRIEFDGQGVLDPLIPYGDVSVEDRDGSQTVVVTLHDPAAGAHLMRAAASIASVRSLTREEPTLEDAFIALTGKELGA